MYRTGILLLGMASLVASGILIDRNRFGLYPYQAGLALNAAQGLDRPNIFSRDELLQQKFILDILEQINLELENQELLQLGNGDVTNENLYLQPLNPDMLYVLDLIRTNQMLTRNQGCRISDDLHLRQMVGLYKLFLNARDLQTFQRLVIYGRRYINTELFVNSLILSLGERSDTKMLIIPAMYEILPHLYHDSDLIEQIRNIDEQSLLSQSEGDSSLRPNLLDVITLGRQNRLYNSRRPEMSGMINILNRSELWMPWRRLHQQLALRKSLGERGQQQDLKKYVVSLPARGIQEQPLGLFTEDLGFKSYINRLIDDLIVQQESPREIERAEEEIRGEPRYPYRREEYTTENSDRDLFSQRREDLDRSSNTDQFIFAGQRSGNRLDSNRGIYGLNYGNRLDNEYKNTERPLEAARELLATPTTDQNIPYAGRRLRNRFSSSLAERQITTTPEEYRPSITGQRNGIDNINYGNRFDTLRNNEKLGQSYGLNYEKIDRPLEARKEIYATQTSDQSIPYAGRRLRNRFSTPNAERQITQFKSLIQTQERDILVGRKDDSISLKKDTYPTQTQDRNILAGRQNTYPTHSQDRDILAGRKDDVISLSDKRIPYAGRRRQNFGGYGQSYEFDAETISDGRHVARDEQKDGRDQRKEKYDDNSQFTYRRENPYTKRQDDRDLGQQQYANMESNPGYRLYEQQQESFNRGYGNNGDLNRGLYYRTKYGQGGVADVGQSPFIGRDRNAFLDTIYSGRQDEDQYRISQGKNRYQSNYLRNDDEIYQTELPTTSRNDERLPNINRRRLDEVQEGRRVGNFGDDEYQRKNSLFGRSRFNAEEEGDRKYVDRDGDNLRRYATNEQEGDRKFVDRDGDRDIGRSNLYNRRGYNEEEGDRKYVDRDDDGIRGGSRFNRRGYTEEEEGDRKYVDRDDDGGRAGSRLNRRIRNVEEGDRKYVDRDDDGSRAGKRFNRRGHNNEVGDRKYVDRDDDGSRGGRRGHNNEEGDRKYVDRDDDGSRGGRIFNRRIRNAEEGDRKYVDRDDDGSRGGRRGHNTDEGDRKYVDRDDDSSRGGRRGHTTEEGDRKYVDRDDDSSRGGRRGHTTEEGDRKYVDRDDDGNRGGYTFNRPTQQNIDRQSNRRDNVNRQSDQTFQRYRRSLGNEKSLNGRLLIHNLQQLAARINIQRISLGQTQQLDDYLKPSEDRRLINDISSRSSLSKLTNPILYTIRDISQRLEAKLQEEIPRLSALTNEEQFNEIGLLLAGQIQELDFLDLLREILRLDFRNDEGQLTNLLDRPLFQLSLCRFVDMLDGHLKKLQYDRDITLSGVTINNIKLDRLQTYLEYSDVDLTNLLSINIDQTAGSNKKLVVGRIPRLNHKSFNIKLDIDSDRQQQVVIRTFLGPKTDARGNILSLIEQRQNYILLDINRATLKGGRNLITLKSSDISWTARDTTPCSEIYRRVMLALDDDLPLSKDLLIGQSNLFPHRLLIPRGLSNGLPMQLLTVITPIDSESNLKRNLIGLDALQLDRLPLNYPLDGDIQDLQSFLNVPNIYLKDVAIYHDDNIRLSGLL